MEVLSTIAEIIRDLLIFVAVMTGMLVVLIVTVSKMPDSNPLKRLLTALTYRIGATAAAGACLARAAGPQGASPRTTKAQRDQITRPDQWKCCRPSPKSSATF